jgi:HEAT repeat protein
MPLRRAELTDPAPQAPGYAACLTQLASRDADARRGAAIALGRHEAAAGANQAILGALAEQLQTEPDRFVRAAIFAAFGNIGGDAAARLLAPFLRMDDAGLRNGAVETLRRLGEDAVTAVDRLLRDADPDVRLLAVEVMRVWPPALALPRLDMLLAQEAHVNVMGGALDVAQTAGDASLLPALAAAQARFAGEGFVAFAIAEAMRSLAPRPGARPAQTRSAAAISRRAVKPGTKKPTANQPRKPGP